MNRLSTAKRTQVMALVEGNSINATCRMLGVRKHAVLRLLEDARALPVSVKGDYGESKSGFYSVP
jgi:hypothetical protein